MKIPNSTLKFIALLILIIVVSCQNDDNGGDDDNPNPNRFTPDPTDYKFNGSIFTGTIK